MAERAVVIAQQIEAPSMEIRAREWTAHALLVAGWPLDAKAEVQWAVEQAERLKSESDLLRLSVLSKVVGLAESEPEIYEEIRQARGEYTNIDFRSAIRRLDKLRNRMPEALMLITARIEILRTRVWLLVRQMREARAAAARAHKWASDGDDLEFSLLSKQVLQWLKNPDVTTTLARIMFFMNHQRPDIAIAEMHRVLEHPWPKDAPISEVAFRLGLTFAYRVAERFDEAEIEATRVQLWAIERGEPWLARRVKAVQNGFVRMNCIYQGWTP